MTFDRLIIMCKEVKSTPMEKLDMSLEIFFQGLQLFLA